MLPGRQLPRLNIYLPARPWRDCSPPRRSRVAQNDPHYTTLSNFFHRHFGPPDSEGFQRARRFFVESLAANSIVTYLLQVIPAGSGKGAQHMQQDACVGVGWAVFRGRLLVAICGWETQIDLGLAANPAICLAAVCHLSHALAACASSFYLYKYT